MKHIAPTSDPAGLRHDGFRELVLPDAGGEATAPSVVARLPELLDVEFAGPAALQALLAEMDIAIIGTGSIGMRVAFELARLGIHTLRLVDPGRLKAESVLTYPVTIDAVGRAKVEHAGESCKRISPRTRVLTYAGRVEDLDTVAFLDTTLVVLAPDLLAPEVAAGRHARLLGRPIIRAAVHGGTLVVQLRSYAGGDNGPCTACFFGDREWEDVYRQTRYSCDGTDRGLGGAVTQPTRSFGALCSLAADLTVLEVLRRLLPVGRARGDVLLEYRGYTHEMCETPLSRTPDCPGEHRALARVPVAASLSGAPLAELFAQVGIEAAEVGPLTVTVDQERFVERTRCACPSARAHGRFVAPGEDLGTCAACGAARAADPLTTHHEVPGEVLLPFLARSLGALGVPAARAITVRGGGVRALIHAAS